MLVLNRGFSLWNLIRGTHCSHFSFKYDLLNSPQNNLLSSVDSIQGFSSLYFQTLPHFSCTSVPKTSEPCGQVYHSHTLRTQYQFFCICYFLVLWNKHFIWFTVWRHILSCQGRPGVCQEHHHIASVFRKQRAMDAGAQFSFFSLLSLWFQLVVWFHPH